MSDRGQILRDTVQTLIDDFQRSFKALLDLFLVDAAEALKAYDVAAPVEPPPAVDKREKGMFIHGAWEGNGGWTGRWSKANLQKFRDAGADHFRIGVKWNIVEATRGSFNEIYLATIDSLITDINDLGMTYYFDFVHLYKSGGVEQGLPGWTKDQVNGTASIAKYAQAYTQMLARRYKDKPGFTGYDINEPDDWQSANNVLRMHNTVIGWIRAIDTENLYYLEPSYGNGDPTNGDPSIITNKSNVVLSVHDYFMGWGSDGRAIYGYDGTTGWYNQDAAQLRKWLDIRKAWADRAGIPLHVGEWGIGAAATNRDAWIRAMVEIARTIAVDTTLDMTWWEGRTGSGDRLSAMDTSYNVKPYIRDIALAA